MSNEEFANEFLQYKLDLYKYALSLCRNTNKAHDLVQETYLKALMYKDSYTQDKNNNKAKSWLFVILKRQFLGDIYVTKKKHNTIDIDTLRISHPKNEPCTTNDSFSSEVTYTKENKIMQLEDHLIDELVDKIANYTERFDDVIISSIMTLPNKFRKYLIMKDIENYSYDDIAKMFNVPMQTVKNNIRKSRILIKPHLINKAKEYGIYEK